MLLTVQRSGITEAALRHAPCDSTAAAVAPAAPARPLDARWLARLVRSSAAWPVDAPPDALDRIRAHPQFR